jgi:predicted metal-dependent phosphoesterase TrpH
MPRLRATKRSRTVRVDMHNHTWQSFDCVSDPTVVLETAKARGLDWIAITDHNAIDAALELRDLAPDRIIVGEEVKTREGFDVIGLFLSELIPKRTPARETCEWIRAQGGVVYIPHPFDVARSGAGQTFLQSLEPLIDVIEVHNSRCLLEAHNQRALEWADRHAKLRGAGSDSHTTAEIAHGYVDMPPFMPNRASFLASLAAGEVTGRVRSSPIHRLSSTFAKVRKLFG